MRSATRARIHIDRAARAWLIRRHIGPAAEFVFVNDPVEAPDDATPFDMPGAELGYRGEDCTFETALRQYDLTDPVVWKIAQLVHQADLDDERFDALPVPTRPRPGAGRADPDGARRRHRHRCGLAPVRGAALRAIGEAGLDAEDDDQRLLERGLFVYDAMYAWCRRATGSATR